MKAINSLRRRGLSMHKPSSNSTTMHYPELSLPTVSVVIPYYKQEDFLVETIQTVKKQTYPKIEIIVVDDGSPVRADLVLGSAAKDVIVFRTKNSGCPSARNFGFRKSRGDYIIFLDSDDRLAPGAIEAHLRAFAGHPDAVLSFGAIRIIDENNVEVRPAHICRPRDNYFLMLLECNPIGCPGAAMIRRDAFVEVGLFDESFRIVEDYRLYLKLARRHRIVQHDFCVVEYRFHSSSGSQDKERMLTATMAALDKLELESSLSDFERSRLCHGRLRWKHVFRYQKTLAYRLKGLYFNLHAMLTVPAWSYFTSGKNSR
jgi:glycosyltransferase involved in cell wall biosynthesis